MNIFLNKNWMFSWLKNNINRIYRVSIRHHRLCMPRWIQQFSLIITKEFIVYLLLLFYFETQLGSNGCCVYENYKKIKFKMHLAYWKIEIALIATTRPFIIDCISRNLIFILWIEKFNGFYCLWFKRYLRLHEFKMIILGFGW